MKKEKIYTHKNGRDKIYISLNNSGNTYVGKIANDMMHETERIARIQTSGKKTIDEENDILIELLKNDSKWEEVL